MILGHYSSKHNVSFDGTTRCYAMTPSTQLSAHEWPISAEHKHRVITYHCTHWNIIFLLAEWGRGGEFLGKNICIFLLNNPKFYTKLGNFLSDNLLVCVSIPYSNTYVIRIIFIKLSISYLKFCQSFYLLLFSYFLFLLKISYF